MVPRYLAANLLILASDFALYAAFVGVGLGFRRVLGFRSLSIDDCLLAFWMGLAITVFGLMVAHFFTPIRAPALFLLLTVGGLSLWLRRRDLLRIGKRALSRDSAPWIAAFLLISFWLANLSLAPMVNSDSAGYHLPAIQWIAAYPVVPGLANLFGPLGFNSASFLYGALLNVGPWNGHAFHLANGLLILAAVTHGMLAGRRLLRPQDNATGRNIFELLMLVPAIALVAPDVLPSYATDAPTTLVMLVVIPLIYREFTNEGELREREYRLVAIAVLLALGVCMKMHVALFATVVWPPVMWNWISSRRASHLPWVRTSVTAILLIGSFSGVWITTGIIQSGYPFFPLPNLGVSTDWRVPVEHARAESAFIVHSTRVSAVAMGTDPDVEKLSGWLPRWWRVDGRRDPSELLIPLVLAVAGGLLRTGRRARGGKALATGQWVPFIWLSVGVGVLGWFLSTPAPRYAIYLFWAWVALVWTPLLTDFAGSNPVRRRFIAVVCGILVFSPAAVLPGVRALRGKRNPFVAIVRMNVNRPPAVGLFPAMHEPAVTVFTTASGLSMKVPVNAEAGRCWATPLPCTPNPAVNLVLRDARDIRRGFRVEGDWQMIDWPYPRYSHFLEAWRATRAADPRRAR